MLSKECKLHMEEAGMTRWQHFWHAVKIAYKLEKAATRVVIHAFAPRFYKTYATDTMRNILEEHDNRKK